MISSVLVDEHLGTYLHTLVSQITGWHVLLVLYDLEDDMKEWNIMLGKGCKESVS